MQVARRNLRKETTSNANRAPFVSSAIIPLDGFLSDVLPHPRKNRLNGSRRTSNATASQKLKGERRVLGHRVAGMPPTPPWAVDFNGKVNLRRETGSDLSHDQFRSFKITFGESWIS